MELKENIKFYRKSLKLTQKELGEKLGVVRTTICEYESGRNEPDVKMLIRLADIFDVTLDELIGRE